ncbi:MAG: 4a-hydroxytetrahydrobiopterin dehydratase [Salinicola sp.]|uniref:4a-hydroxytetrahydrobiopterin dehydratase n=1 Tax=Salinicola sp. TaxID=1978524 RepID=UPI000C968CF7|nr:4a-hydroxytetrahydrobiopterin dehydratase [Salinicola sp.]MAM56717.1 4a-hydroxytetrahydrobiopterin dehydratase [Salinicola sp.]NRB57838.1 4a-hydroxytetrahydrobiopterin dehydratase [Salinicola sp.]
MPTLAEQHCSACHGEAARLTPEQIDQLLPALPKWQIVERGGIMQLQRSFTFRNFAQALDFTNRVGELAESQGHHPAITTEWGKATVTWWTHKIRGLHRNDFIMAARTDEVVHANV